ncbi:MAG: TIGR04211 family SH3 domain-containing protein [Desulfamplus sp.]|nr:TIGR04211 family SH3 domain-containing protein [Desulfamplus sp.]
MKTIQKHYVIYILSALICFSLTVLTAIPSAFAETGYISDMLILSLKEGPGRQYSTIKTLRSNTQVEIVETTERFLKVKTEEGDLGWVESQYITKELPKALIIEQLNKRIAQLEGKDPNVEKSQIAGQGVEPLNQTTPLSSNLENIKASECLIKIQSLEAALNNQLEKNRLLEAQLRGFKADQSKITVEQSSSKEDESSFEKDQDSSKNEESENKDSDNEDISLFSTQDMKDIVTIPDDDLLKTAMIKWFCAGAGVLIAGWFIGRSFSGGRRGGGLLD